MNKELQLLYMKLAPEDRDKVDAKIYELLARQMDPAWAKDRSDSQQQERPNK